jgi:hypothetical protein
MSLPGHANTSEPPKCFECEAPAAVSRTVVPAEKGGTRTVDLCASCHDLVAGRASLNVTRALQLRQERGEWIGKTPIGFRVVRRQRTLCVYEQRVITRILALHEEGESLASIQAALYRDQLWPRRNGHWARPSLRKRGRWSCTAIRNVIKRHSKGKP